jgi:hypothetical protein
MSEFKRAERIFATDLQLTAMKLPKHVANWAFEYNDQLHEIYTMIKGYCEQKSLYILDKANFANFCACLARLSSINAPRTYHDLVYDFYADTSIKAGAGGSANDEKSMSNEMPADTIGEEEDVDDEGEDGGSSVSGTG